MGKIAGIFGRGSVAPSPSDVQEEMKKATDESIHNKDSDIVGSKSFLGMGIAMCAMYLCPAHARTCACAIDRKNNVTTLFI